MSHVSAVRDRRPAVISLADMLTILDRFGCDFQQRDGGLRMKNVGMLTDELRQSVAENKTALLLLCDCRADLIKLHGHLIRLRCEDPPKGTRAQALIWLSNQIEKLAARSISIGGTAHGWPDPTDELANGHQIMTLWEALDEIEAGPYPVPLPAGCQLLPAANFDPFAVGRLYNGAIRNGQG